VQSIGRAGQPQLAVGGHLAASTGTSPLFVRFHQRPADTPTSHVRINVPSLDLADRGRVATVRPGAEGRFQETAEPTAGPLGDEECAAVAEHGARVRRNAGGFR
jgi:hypothetical protein